ncbi:C40 family peptidase [Streptomyces sp. SBT349]|uniref:C40 family peptidase n=1 Tax=Streptomyces sp. SBT349 TaxID=1580539 RepID=UPI00066D4F4F|nr:C40 family peptidase [Streptomyces sp. SBT349]
MSPIRYRGRHRKPRPSRTGGLIRGGVLTGVVGTVAVTGSSAQALAAEKPTESTGELPALDLALAHGADRASQATAAYVSEAETQQNRRLAQSRAATEARSAAADRRAEAEAAAERRAQEEAERRAAEEAAARQEAEEAAQEPRTLSAPASAPATGGSAAAVVDFVTSQLGDAYSMGSSGPGAWDCSGLTQAAFAGVGVSLPRTAAEQSVAGTQVSLDALQAGDILYWGGAGSAYHVAVYTGDGTFIGAQNPSSGVVQQTLDWDPPTGAVRVL